MTRLGSMAVEGLPQPKQRARTFVDKAGRVRTITPAATKAYEELVGLSWRGPRRSEGPLSVTIDVYEAVGQRGGDLDNYVKSILDGLNGVAWIDDSQVVDLHAHIERSAVFPRIEVGVNSA